MPARPVRTGLAVIAVWIAACGEPGATQSVATVAPPAARPEARIDPVLMPSADQLAAADPLLDGFDGWPLAFDARFHPTGASCELRMERGGVVVRTIAGTLDASHCRATWDARDDAGAVLRPGPVTVVGAIVAGAAELASATSELEIVRLGVDRVSLTGAARVPLLYRATGGVRDGWYEIDVAHTVWQMAPDRSEAMGAPLELPDGTPRPAPPIHDDVLSPPLDPRSPDGVEHDTFSLPTAWVADAEIGVEARLSSSVAGALAGGDPMRNEVRVVAPEQLAIDGDAAFADGSTIALHTITSPVPAVGRYDVEWAFRFEARAPGGEWHLVPGRAPVRVRLYGLVGPPVFGFDTIPHRAWVDIVDTIAGWVDGSADDWERVAARVVSGVYYELGLRYDTARGASFYTSYSRSGYRDAVFSAQSFQLRSNGTIVNCSDAASILTTYANMVGIDLRYHILTNRFGGGFDLNYIRAIGMPAFDDTPFDSGRGGFNYHAIVGSRDGRTWDATLALDGDADPASAPHSLLLPQGVGAMSYLVALSSQADVIRTDHDDFTRIR